jgi:regulator of replication initiation timing
VKNQTTGEILLVKKFLPELSDKWSGQTVTTGYTALTETEYKLLCTGSPTFRHYKDKLKHLVVCEELPAEAKTPHQALRDARKDAKKVAAEAAALSAENEQLKAKLFDAETQYKELLAASTGEAAEKLIAETSKLGEASGKITQLTAQVDALKAENEKLKTDAVKTPRKGGDKGKDFE